MAKLKHVVPFENSDFLDLEYSHDGLFVRLARRMRVRPYVGMKQPTPHGAVMGLELHAVVADRGQMAVGYNWLVYRGKRVLYRGKTDATGLGLIPLGLAYGVAERLTLEIWRPGRSGSSLALERRKSASAASRTRGEVKGTRKAKEGHRRPI